MWRDFDRNWVVFGLLALHVGWIGNHIRWVINDEINPWKLGGYAMYTVPSPKTRVQVYDANFTGKPIKVKTVGYSAATRFTNSGRSFRCADVPAAALLTFFEENKDLIGRNLVFVYAERRFVRDPPSTKNEMQGSVIVVWQDERTFIYKNRFCGREATASATLPEATLPRITTALP
jgi:hypothetical protein